MANMLRNVTRTKFLEQLRAAFPTWVFDMSSGELNALTDKREDWEATRKDLQKLLVLVRGMNVLVTTQNRAGRTVITIDVRELPN